MTESKRGQSLFRKGAIHHIGGWKGASTQPSIGTDGETRTFCAHGCGVGLTGPRNSRREPHRIALVCYGGPCQPRWSCLQLSLAQRRGRVLGLHVAQERLSQTPANLIGPPPPGGLHGSADPQMPPTKAEPCLFS